MKKEVKKRKEIVQYSKKCPKCNKDIKGFSESQVGYNLKLHIEKHERENGNR